MKIKPGYRISLREDPEVLGTILEVTPTYVFVQWDDTEGERILPIQAIGRVWPNASTR